MAHFAKLDENNIVLNVHVVADSDCQKDGVEDEETGRQFLQKIHNWPYWRQTSYNTYNNQHKLGGTPFRGNYAGIGDEWDEDNQIFWYEKPYPSWVKNVSTASWESPIGPAPDLTSEQVTQNESTHWWEYQWNESDYQSDNSTGWVLVNKNA